MTPLVITERRTPHGVINRPCCRACGWRSSIGLLRMARGSRGCRRSRVQRTERIMIMSTIGSWAVGHNMAGYLPNPDNVSSYADRADATTALVDLMREYADGDDDATAELLPTDPVEATAHGYRVTAEGIDYGDDYPAMRATVDSILADDGPDRVPGDWSAWAESGDHNRVVFWIMRTTDPADES